MVGNYLDSDLLIERDTKSNSSSRSGVMWGGMIRSVVLDRRW